MEYKNQTTSELADLQSSINADLSCVKTDLADLQSSINANLSCVKTDLADLQSSVDSVKMIHLITSMTLILIS